MSSRQSSGGGLLEALGIFLAIWFVTFWVFDIQISFRLERVSTDVSTLDAFGDMVDKSTNILDHTELVKQIDVDVPTDE